MSGSATDGQMKLLFVHEHLGALGGAEANIKITAQELQARGHTTALLYQSATGKSENAWRECFSDCFSRPNHRDAVAATEILNRFKPDLIYFHKLPDFNVLDAFTQS